MPVTAKLSRQFYERLGEQVVNELVEWLNQVDAAYKSDLREINELNYARFDAKVDERFTALRSELKGDISALERKLDGSIASLDGKLDVSIASLERRMDVGFADMRTWTEKSLKEQARWFIAAWGALVAALGAVVALLVDIRLRLP